MTLVDVNKVSCVSCVIMEKPHVAALRRAIGIAGSQAALAARIRKFLGRSTFSQQTVSYWVSNETLLDPEWWAAIEYATDRQVTRDDLRPDVCGSVPSTAA